MKVRDIIKGPIKRLDFLDEEVFKVETLVAGDCFRIADNAVKGVGVPYLVVGEGYNAGVVSVYIIGNVLLGEDWSDILVIKISEKEFLDYEQNYE